MSSLLLRLVHLSEPPPVVLAPEYERPACRPLRFLSKYLGRALVRYIDDGYKRSASFACMHMIVLLSGGSSYPCGKFTRHVEAHMS